jgi:methylated-DNA-[protein]-cysteine S-methyltransferase
MTLHVHRFPTPLDDMLAAVDDDGALRLLEFAGPRADASLAREARVTRESVSHAAGRCAHVARQVEEYFRGERADFDLPLAARGTPFQHGVWSELRRIPFGSTVSYRDLAERLGNPAAVRAVGRANGSNPISLIVPCHRVIGANGSLTGYGGGIDRKAKLLALEGADLGGA